MDYIENWKEVIQRPSDFYKRMPMTGGYADPLIFAAISYIIYGLFAALFNAGMSIGSMYGMYGKESSLSMVVVSVILEPVVGIISIFIEATILYIVYRILGGMGSYEGTVRFISYATAVMVFSWVPFIGLIVLIYEVYLYIVGGMFVHNVSMGRSAVAVLLPIILIFILVTALIFFFFIAVKN
jgi:hypothetical protein